MGEHFPELFVARLDELFGVETSRSILASMNARAPVAFRVNGLLGDSDTVLADLDREAIAWRACDAPVEAYAVDADARAALTVSAAAAAGTIYIQNLSSMLAAAALGAQPGEEVLDLAAAPGGKTIMLAGTMQNRGRLAAVEAVRGRFHRLRANLERHGVTIAQCYCKDGAVVGRQVPGRFDRVLLDAPCSSEARFTEADPASFRYWSEKKIAEMQRKQKKLLYSAVLATRPGGVIVYSTCSFAPEENEGVIDHVLRKFRGELAVEPIAPPVANAVAGIPSWRGRRFDPAVFGSTRILPEGPMSGFFICRLRRTAQAGR